MSKELTATEVLHGIRLTRESKENDDILIEVIRDYGRRLCENQREICADELGDKFVTAQSISQLREVVTNAPKPKIC